MVIYAPILQHSFNHNFKGKEIYRKFLHVWGKFVKFFFNKLQQSHLSIRKISIKSKSKVTIEHKHAREQVQT